MGRFLRGHVWKVTHERSLGAVEETRSTAFGRVAVWFREMRGRGSRFCQQYGGHVSSFAWCRAGRGCYTCTCRA